ncbi:MAG TPA: carboxymuconolactone decarboxylase family protein [Gemmatimonadaceae bacterium]
MSHYDHLYPEATRDLAEQRSRLAPAPATAYRAFTQSVFVEGALSVAIKELIAMAVAQATQWSYCIRSHTRVAMQQGATAEPIMEGVWVAAEMRAGGAYAHSALALDAIARTQAEKSSEGAK